MSVIFSVSKNSTNSGVNNDNNNNNNNFVIEESTEKLLQQLSTFVDENNASDKQKMQLCLKNLREWLQNVPVPKTTSVTAFVNTQPEPISSLWHQMAEVLVNGAITEYVGLPPFLDEKLAMVKEDWSDFQEEPQSEMHDFWSRCQTLLEIVFTRVEASNLAKKQIIIFKEEDEEIQKIVEKNDSDSKIVNQGEQVVESDSEYVWRILQPEERINVILKLCFVPKPRTKKVKRTEGRNNAEQQETKENAKKKRDN